MFSIPGRNPAASPPRALLLDALGTLVALEPPAPRLRTGLAARLGIEIGEADAARAMRVEIAYYRTHLHEAADPEGLADLRRRCAALVRDELGVDAAVTDVLGVLLDALRFTAFDDAEPALRALRRGGLALVVVSNWDVSLHEVLDRTGLRPLVDGAISSAETGSAKPDGEIFARALALTGTRADETWHVGDSPDADVEGARRAGIGAVLIDRSGGDEGPVPQPGAHPIDDTAGPGTRRIASLAELPSMIRAGGPYPCPDGL